MSDHNEEPQAVAVPLLDRPISALAVAVVVIAAVVAAFVWGLTGALAHHPTYNADATCDGVTASATYVGGSGRRLILISGVTVNGDSYQASWSNVDVPVADRAPDDSGDGGTPVGTNGVIPYNSYGGTKPAAIGDANFNFLWVGVDDGWTIFDYTNPVFNPAP